MIDYLQTLDKESFAVLLVLKERAEGDETRKFGLTVPEISRLANVGMAAVEVALDKLSQMCYAEVLPNKIVVDGKAIPFTKRNTDSTRLAKLEIENQRLRTTLATYQKSSGLGQIASEYDREAIRKIEGLYGRGLTTDEGYLLGCILTAYGPQRSLNAVSHNIDANNPLRAAFGMLRGGAIGKKIKRDEKAEPKVQAANIESILD